MIKRLKWFFLTEHLLLTYFLEKKALFLCYIFFDSMSTGCYILVRSFYKTRLYVCRGWAQLSHELDSFMVRTNWQVSISMWAQVWELWVRSIQRVIGLPRADTEKLIYRINNVDIVEGQINWGTRILPPPQLIGYLNESEYSTSVIFNLT